MRFCGQCFVSRATWNSAPGRLPYSSAGPDICWPYPLNPDFCGPLPAAGAAAGAAARCKAEPSCRAFGLNRHFASCTGPNNTKPQPGELCPKFFTVANRSQLLVADGWQMWLDEAA